VPLARLLQLDEQIDKQQRALAKSQQILAELKDVPGFSDLTPRQQAKAYAATVGSEVPWSILLHQARTGDIKLDVARQLFTSHAEARDLLSRLSGVDEKQ
jgi:hypothetical protein